MYYLGAGTVFPMFCLTLIQESCTKYRRHVLAQLSPSVLLSLIYHSKTCNCGLLLSIDFYEASYHFHTTSQQSHHFPTNKKANRGGKKAWGWQMMRLLTHDSYPSSLRNKWSCPWEVDTVRFQGLYLPELKNEPREERTPSCILREAEGGLRCLPMGTRGEGKLT